MSEYMKFADSVTRRSASRSLPAPPLRRMAEALARRWRERSRRRSYIELHQLDDHQLKDVGLFREVWPNGAVRYRRV